MINDDELEDDEFDDDENWEEEPLTLDNLEGEIGLLLQTEDLDDGLIFEIMDSIRFHLSDDRKPGVIPSDESLIGVLSPSVSHECQEVLVSYCLGRRGLDTTLRETIYQVAIFNRDKVKLVILVTDKWNKKIWKRHQKAFDGMGPPWVVFMYSSGVFTTEF